MTGESRSVRVRYVPTGFGLSLAIEETDIERSGEEGTLHVTDACITLEVPKPSGGLAVMAWDPAEVAWESLQPT